MQQHDPEHGRAIVLLACAAFASMASMRVCDSMLPQLATTFAVSTGKAASAVSAFAIAYGLMQLVYGALGDRYGKLRVATFAALACTLGTFACAMVSSLPALVAARALAGASAGGIIPLSLAWIGDTVAYEQRQATLARFLTGTIAGLILGQLIGGVFADTVGWRGAFILLTIAFAVVGALLATQLRKGAIASSGAPAGQAFLPRVVSVLSLPWTRVILATVCLEGLLGFAALAFVPSYLHHRFGLSLSGAGAVLSVFGVGGLIYTTFAARLIPRLREHGLVSVGSALAGLAFVVLLLAPHWSWAIASSLITGLGLYMLHNTLQINATQMAPHARGTAVALFATALFLGQSIGVALGGLMIDRFRAQWIFAASAIGLWVIGVMFARSLRRRQTSTDPAK